MDELDHFFQAIFKWDVAQRFVSPSAISQARRKLSHRVFIELLDNLCRFVNEHASLKTFHGFRVFAVDGSTMRLPDNEEVRAHFGATRNQSGKRAMGRVSLLFDALNRLTYDAILGNFHVGEISMAWQHLEEAELPENSMILLDRGYYDFALMRNILDQGHHFCIRLRSNLGIFRAFNQSNQQDLCLNLKPPKQHLKSASPNSPYRKSFTVRIVRYQVKRKVYTLMTSLLDAKTFPIAELADLYHKRWQIEESYKTKKCRIHIEHVSGMTPEMVLQDFHGRVFAECLTASLLTELEEEIENRTRGRKHVYRSCFTQALSKMKHVLALLFLRRRPAKIIKALMDIFSRSLVSIEPGRCYPRKGPGRFGSKAQSHSFGYRLNC